MTKFTLSERELPTQTAPAQSGKAFTASPFEAVRRAYAGSCYRY